MQIVFPITLQLLVHGGYNVYIFERNAGVFILSERLKTRQAVAKKASHNVHVMHVKPQRPEPVRVLWNVKYSQY